MMRLSTIDAIHRVAVPYANTVRECLTDARPYFPAEMSDEAMLVVLYQIGFVARQGPTPASKHTLPVKKRAPLGSKSERVRLYIKDCGLATFSTKSVIEATGLANDDVSKILSRLSIRKVIKKTGRGAEGSKWRVIQ
jgi:hypothetical protein